MEPFPLPDRKSSMPFLETALRWLLPQTCAHCREDIRDVGRTLCDPCGRRLLFCEPPYCARCAARVPPGRAHCDPCTRGLKPLAMIRAAFLYRGPAVSAVHALKYRGRFRVGAEAGSWLAAALARRPELAEADALVPMPLHPRRIRERGYNQALLLARGLSAAARLPVLDILERRRATRTQWRLGRAARRANLAGALALREPEAAFGRKLLIIDDVCTTGASLEECGRVLAQAGAVWTAGLTLARES